MIKNISIVILLAGIGWFLSADYRADGLKSIEVQRKQPTESPRTAGAVISANPFIVENAQVMTDHEQLSKQIRNIEERLRHVEKLLVQTDAPPEIDATNITPHSSRVDTPVSAMSRILSEDNLIKAGLDGTLARNIVRRKNQLELQKLELRDQAIRENYVNTPRYTRELKALNDSDISLREELGDDVYDEYLYASGVANRVKAVSVMMGSAAEQAGVLSGDVILSYDNQAIFGWMALREATTVGQRGEYVSLEVLRNGQYQSLWLPRGPLGIRLGSSRINPAD